MDASTRLNYAHNGFEASVLPAEWNILAAVCSGVVSFIHYVGKLLMLWCTAKRERRTLPNPSKGSNMPSAKFVLFLMQNNRKSLQQIISSILVWHFLFVGNLPLATRLRSSWWSLSHAIGWLAVDWR